jgi:hypothetical protein
LNSNTIRRAVLFLFLFAATAPVLRATVYVAQDGAFAAEACTAAGQFAAAHGGRSPSSWGDIEAYLTEPLDEVYTDLLPTKRYAFLTRPLQLPAPYTGDLIIVNRKPYRELTAEKTMLGTIQALTDPGRYIIYRTRDGGFHSAYVDETYIQTVFENSPDLLPTPDREPERSWEHAARRSSIVGWVAPVAIFCLVGYWFLTQKKSGGGGKPHEL